MKNSFLFIIFLFFINCSPKIDISIDIEDIKKNGIEFIQNNKTILAPRINLISKVSLYDKKQITSWEQPYFNYSNLTPNSNFENKNIIKKNNYYFKYNKKNNYKKKILVIKEKIIYIDDYGNLIVLNKKLDLLKKINLYKKKKYKKFPLKYSIASKNNQLYIADNLGFLFSFNLSTLLLTWSNNLEVPFLSNLIIYKDSLFATNSNGKIYSFDIATGKQKWSYETGTQIVKNVNAFKIGIYLDKLIFSNDFGNITCIDLKNRSVLWSMSLEPSNKASDISLLNLSNIVTENNFVYVSSNFGKILKIDLNNGRTVWSSKFSSANVPVINKFTIAAVNEEGLFSIFNKKNGKVLFRRNVLNMSVNSVSKKPLEKINNLFISNNFFFMTSTKGVLYQISANNLELFKFRSVAKEIKSNIAIAKKNIFLIVDKNYIFKIQ